MRHRDGEHISTIYSDHEQSPKATIRKFLIVQTEGSRRIERLVGFYSLDMILAIGYRVRSHRGVQFRCWDTEKGSIPCGRQAESCKIQSPPSVHDYISHKNIP
ncbi:MAG: RhuM family protein [Methanothrix sp.]|uniref:RhuM family protein n=1 Tax=Methanothrix sp. TaxID=90426 RepID=UPI003BB6E554